MPGAKGRSGGKRSGTGRRKGQIGERRYLVISEQAAQILRILVLQRENQTTPEQVVEELLEREWKTIDERYTALEGE